ncbi:MAG: DsrE family protein [Candidatus Thermoplasmatota archaeon]|nr:DsrE family protein [Candidatus Thermoplasmatota archaeon]
MSDKALIIISSGSEAEGKAVSGMLLALNMKKYKLLSDVKLIFFGPSEKAIAEGNREFMDVITQLQEAGIIPVACSRIADRDKLTEKITELKIELSPVGPIIASCMKEGYQVLSF